MLTTHNAHGRLSGRQNISTYAPIHATTREYIPARKIPYMEEIYIYSNGTSSVQTIIPT